MAKAACLAGRVVDIKGMIPVITAKGDKPHDYRKTAPWRLLLLNTSIFMAVSFP